MAQQQPIPINLKQHMQTTYDLRIQEQVGSGFMARVYRAFKSHNQNVHYAVKVVDFQGSESNSNTQRIKLQYQMEVDVLKLLQSQNGIPRIQHHGIYQNYAYFVMNFVGTHSLKDWHNSIIQLSLNSKVETNRQIELDSFLEYEGKISAFKQNVIIMMAQLLLILEKLEEYGIIHRDLKLENIMVNPLNQLSIIDFGTIQLQPDTPSKQQLACRQEWKNIVKLDKELNSQHDYIVGSKHYLSPELISGKRNRLISTKIDIWALGVILYRLLCNKYPFEDPTPHNINSLFRKIREQQIDYPNQLTVPQIQIIKACLNKNPTLRPTIQQLKSYKYFSCIDWNSFKNVHSFLQINDFTKNSHKKCLLLFTFDDKNIQYWEDKKLDSEQPLSSFTNLSEYEGDKLDQQSKTKSQTNQIKIKKYKNVQVKIVEQQEIKWLKIGIGGGSVISSNIQDLSISKINGVQAKLQDRKRNQAFALRFGKSEQLQQFISVIIEIGAAHPRQQQ